jgi:hypothetical protein
MVHKLLTQLNLERQLFAAGQVCAALLHHGDELEQLRQRHAARRERDGERAVVGLCVARARGACKHMWARPRAQLDGARNTLDVRRRHRTAPHNAPGP